MPWYRSFSFYSGKRCTKKIYWQQQQSFAVQTTLSQIFVPCCTYSVSTHTLCTDDEDGKWSSIYCFIISCSVCSLMCVCVCLCGTLTMHHRNWQRQSRRRCQRRLRLHLVVVSIVTIVVDVCKICSRFNAQSTCRSTNKFVFIYTEDKNVSNSSKEDS